MLPCGHPVEQGLAKCASGKVFWAPVGLLKGKEMLLFLCIKFMDVEPEGSSICLCSCEKALDFHLSSGFQDYICAASPRHLYRVR